MTLETLRTKARRGSIEVEHLLAAAKARIPGVGAELRRMQDEYNWSRRAFLLDGTHVVPLGAWAEVAATYADDGLEGLHPLARQRENAVYVIGLLEEIKSSEALDALLLMYGDVVDSPGTDIETAARVANCCNIMLCVGNRFEASETQAAMIRRFLMTFIPVAQTETQKAVAALGLRGVGDKDSLAFVTALNNFSPPWTDVRKHVIKAIRNRLK